MANNGETIKWSALRGMNVQILAEGRSAGIVEDFYIKVKTYGQAIENTATVYALKVRTRIEGDRVLPGSAIETIGPDAVIVKNAETLARELPPLPLGSSLMGRKVQGENGRILGTISEIWLGIVPPSALRIAGFELENHTGRAHRHRGFTANSVLRYEDDVIVVQEQIARHLD